MAGETDHLPDGQLLNVVSLREYVDIRFDALNRSIQVGSDVMNARLESMNEFRGAMRDQAGRLITREEHHSMCPKDRVEKLEQWQARMEGKASQSSVLVAYAISAVAMALSLVGVVVNIVR